MAEDAELIARGRDRVGGNVEDGIIISTGVRERNWKGNRCIAHAVMA